MYWIVILVYVENMMVGWLVDWLIGWFVEGMNDRFVDFFILGVYLYLFLFPVEMNVWGQKYGSTGRFPCELWYEIAKKLQF